jgi:hypothetical protein
MARFLVIVVRDRGRIGFYIASVLAGATGGAFASAAILDNSFSGGCDLNFPPTFATAKSNGKIFYGWYIVGVGFLSHVACAFRHRLLAASRGDGA